VLLPYLPLLHDMQVQLLRAARNHEEEIPQALPVHRFLFPPGTLGTQHGALRTPGASGRARLEPNLHKFLRQTRIPSVLVTSSVLAPSSKARSP